MILIVQYVYKKQSILFQGVRSNQLGFCTNLCRSPRWRAKFGPHKGLQALIAAHLHVHRSTVCRDFAWLGLRRQAHEES